MRCTNSRARSSVGVSAIPIRSVLVSPLMISGSSAMVPGCSGGRFSDESYQQLLLYHTVDPVSIPGPDSTLGERLTFAMARAGLDQTRLGKKVGTPQQVVSKWKS